MEKVWVFGKGEYFNKNWHKCADKYKIVGFLDNAYTEIAFDDENSCYIYPPCKIRELEEYKVIITSVHFIEMWQQLKSLKVEDKRILFLQSDNIVSIGEHLCLLSGEEKYLFSNNEEYLLALRKKACNESKDISAIISMDKEPYSRNFGSERGTAVDRYYIDKFISQYQKYIYGDVMEIGTDMYTKCYGGRHVKNTYICHVEGGDNWLKVNFETGEGIEDEKVDCLICTQTLQYIYDLKTAMQNIYRLLKNNGTVLITVPGIKQLCRFDDQKWGEYWSFTPKSLAKLCKEVADDNDFEVISYGNIKSAFSYMYGVCKEELNIEDLSYNDEQYPFLIGAVLKKDK